MPQATAQVGTRGRLRQPGRCSDTRLLSRDACEAEMSGKRSMGHAVPVSVSTNIPLGASTLRWM